MTNVKSRQLKDELNKNLGNRSRSQDHKDADDNFKKVMMQFKLKEAHHTSENSGSTRPSSDKSKDKQTEEDIADLAELKQGHHVDLKQEARMHFKNLAEEMKNQGGKEVLIRPNNEVQMNGQVPPSASPFRRSKTLSTKLSQDSKLNAGWPSRPISMGNAWRLSLPPSAIKCDKTPPSSIKDMHSTARNMNSAGLPKHQSSSKDVPLSPPSTEVTSNDLPQPSSNASTTDTTDKAVPSTLQQSKINKAGCRYLVLPPLPRTMESCLQPSCNTDTEAQHEHLKPPKNINGFGLPSVRRDIHKDRSSLRETAELCLPSSREQFESKQNHQIPQKSPLQMSNQGESSQIKEQIMQLLLQKPAEVTDILYDIIEKRCGIDLIADDLAKLMGKTSIDCPDNDRNTCGEVPGRRSLKEAPGASLGYTSHHNT